MPEKPEQINESMKDRIFRHLGFRRDNQGVNTSSNLPEKDRNGYGEDKDSLHDEQRDQRRAAMAARHEANIEAKRLADPEAFEERKKLRQLESDIRRAAAFLGEHSRKWFKEELAQSEPDNILSIIDISDHLKPQDKEKLRALFDSGFDSETVLSQMKRQI